DEALEVGAHGDASGGDELDTVTSHRADVGSLDNARVDRDLHGVEDVAAREVDGGGTVEGQRDARLISSDQSVHDPVDVAAGKVVRFELVLVHVGDPGLVGLDQRQNDAVRRHAP